MTKKLCRNIYGVNDRRYDYTISSHICQEYIELKNKHFAYNHFGKILIAYTSYSLTV